MGDMSVKHLVRDVAIFSIHFSGLSFLYRRYMRTKGPLVRVLCFHDVPDSVWFEKVVSLLVQKYHVITPEQFHRNDFNPKRINILLTFDDGYQSWVDVCLPVLVKHNVQGLFFINSGLLDVAHDPAAVAEYMHTKLLLKNIRQPLTWEGAAKLVAAGNMIGGHTVSHVRASEVSEEAWASEVAGDKQTIETALRIVLTDFAFPFGGGNDYSTRANEVCKNIGYINTYSATSGFTKVGDKLTPRLLVEANQKLQSVHSWTTGAYDIFSICRMITK